MKRERKKKGKKFIIREIYECFEPSRLERLATQPRRGATSLPASKSNLDSANFHHDRGSARDEEGERLGSGIMRQVVGPGTRAQSVSGLIRVTMLRENRTAHDGGPFFSLFSFLRPTPFRLVKGFSRSFRFVLEYKII